MVRCHELPVVACQQGQNRRDKRFLPWTGEEDIGIEKKTLDSDISGAPSETPAELHRLLALFTADPVLLVSSSTRE